MPEAVNCDGCGACCYGQGLLPSCGPLLGGVVLPERLQAELDVMVQKHDGDGHPCVWFNLETKRCKHYRYRPSVCRNFEVGGKDCLRISSGLLGHYIAACLEACDA